MAPPLVVPVNASVGWIHARGLSTLTVTAKTLTLSVLFLGRYTFQPGEVVALRRCGWAPLCGGFQIVRTVATYPARIRFTIFGNPEHLREKIQAAGFVPVALPEAIPERKGWPVRWQAIAAFFVLVNAGNFVPAHFLTRLPESWLQFFAPVLVALPLAAVWALLRLSSVQRLVLNPGRSIDEIRPVLCLLRLICSVLLPIFLILSLRGAWTFHTGGWTAP
jgi:hypothetical protein